jgi:hypothetical protein
MREYSSHGMTVYAVPDDHAEVERIAGRIAEQGAAIASAIAPEDTAGISVIIYPGNGALHRKKVGLAGALLPDWYIGDNTRNYVLITSPANPGSMHDRESVERAAVHEYVHVLTDRVNHRLDHWLKEGIALYLAEQTPDLGAIRSMRDLTWEEYSRGGPIHFANVGGYTLAYTLIHYVDQNYGWDSVVALLDRDATWESVLGISERELFDDWTAALQLL